jgi:hypothetical protein
MDSRHLQATCWLVARRGWRRTDLDLWLWLGTGLVAFAAGFRFFGHYWLQVLPPLCLLAGLGAASCRPGLRRVLVVVVAVPAVAAWSIALVDPPNIGAGVVRPVADYVQRHTKPSDLVTVWGNAPDLYWRSGRAPGGALVNTDFVVGKTQGDAMEPLGWPTRRPARSSPSYGPCASTRRSCSSIPLQATFAAMGTTRSPEYPPSTPSSTPTIGASRCCTASRSTNIDERTDERCPNTPVAQIVGRDGTGDSARGHLGEVSGLGFGEQPGPDEEADAFGGFEREAGAASWDDVEGEVRVLPVLVLGCAHVERCAADLTEVHVGATDAELTEREAHGTAAIAAATRLVEEHGPVDLYQSVDQLERLLGGVDTRRRHGQKKPSLSGL